MPNYVSNPTTVQTLRFNQPLPRDGELIRRYLCSERAVPALKCTRAVISRARLKRDHLAPAEATNAVLGNWYVAMSRIDDTNFFTYMSEKSLLSFIMLEGERLTPEKLSACLLHGMRMVIEATGLGSGAEERVLDDYSVGVFSPADNHSLLGSLSNLMQDYGYFMDQEGGLSRCNIGGIIHDINHRPIKQLGWASPFEVSQSLFRGVAI